MKLSYVLCVILGVLVAVESMSIAQNYKIDHDLMEKVAHLLSAEEKAIKGEKTARTLVNNFDGFDLFIDGLSKLQEALNNPNYDWSQMRGDQSDLVLNEVGSPSESGSDPQSSSDIQSSLKDFLVLIEVMNQLTQTQTTTPAPVSQDDLEYLREAESILKNIISTYSDPMARAENHPPPEPEGLSLNDTLNRVSQVFKKVLGNQNFHQNQTQGSGSNEAADTLRNSMGILERARLEYQDSVDSSVHLQKLLGIITELQTLTNRGLPDPEEHVDGLPMALLNENCQTSLQCEQNDEYSICGSESKCICREGYMISEFPGVGLACTLSPPPAVPVFDPKAPCYSPYVEIAYKMCILPMYDLRLPWDDALLYCRTRGLELATDAVVVKVRKYFNRELGEDGSRVRWPLWVGAKKQRNEAGEEQWKWHDGTSVPSFLWPEGNPRTYQTKDTPKGVCMALDGYQQFNADGLPCHLKRRFVCQRPT